MIYRLFTDGFPWLVAAGAPTAADGAKWQPLLAWLGVTFLAGIVVFLWGRFHKRR